MASDRGDVSSAHQGGIEYDSQDDHMDAALQLSFEDSPRNSLRDDDGNPSPSKKPRTPPPARSRASQPHSSDDDDDEEQHDQHRRRADQHATPSRQQQQQQFPPYHPGYPYPYAHPGAGSPGYPPYPPHGFPPPGYPAHQWPGYYYPQYQQHQQAQRHPDLSSSEERHRRDQQQREQEPAGSQTPAKRKGSKTNDERDAGDVTMDTAELSYEESMVDAGPLSPPSSKKKRDASRGAAAAWGSPPREYTRSSTVSSRSCRRALRVIFLSSYLTYFFYSLTRSAKPMPRLNEARRSHRASATAENKRRRRHLADSCKE